MESADHPDRAARGVRFAGRRGDPTGARHLHGRGHHGPGLSAVDARDHVGVRHLDGVDVRHRARRRLLPVHPDAVPRGAACRPSAQRSGGRGDGHLRARGGVVRDDRRRLAHRDLSDQHPGAEVDGYRGDPGRRGRDADGGHPDSGGTGDVRPVGRQEVGAAALVAPAGEHPVAVLDPLGGVGDARPWISAVAASAVLLVMAVPACRWCWATACCASSTRRTRSVPGWPRRPRRWGRARWARCRCWSRFPTAARPRPTTPRRSAAIRQRVAQAPNVASVAPPQFADDNGSALVSAVLSIDPEDLTARKTIDWMRTSCPRFRVAPRGKRPRWTSAAQRR